MQYLQFLERIKRRVISPIYIFAGEEEFLKEEAMARLERILFQEKRVEEKEIFEGRNATVALREALRNVSLFGKAKLIVVKNTQELDASGRDVLLQYIKARFHVNFLIIFLHRDEDKRIWNLPSPRITFVEFKKLYDPDMLNWLISRGRLNKKVISRDVARVFLERVGGDLILLSQALERVINYIGPKNVIEKKDVEEILSDEKKEAVFNLTDALASQDISLCLNILNKLFLSLVSPQQIIGLLSWQIRQIYTIKTGGTVNIPPFFLKRLKSQANRFSCEKLEECLYGLRKIDTEIKSGLKNPRLSLELFFFKFFFKPGQAEA